MAQRGTACRRCRTRILTRRCCAAFGPIATSELPTDGNAHATGRGGLSMDWKVDRQDSWMDRQERRILSGKIVEYHTREMRKREMKVAGGRVYIGVEAISHVLDRPSPRGPAIPCCVSMHVASYSASSACGAVEPFHTDGRCHCPPSCSACCAYPYPSSLHMIRVGCVWLCHLRPFVTLGNRRHGVPQHTDSQMPLDFSFSSRAVQNSEGRFCKGTILSAMNGQEATRWQSVASMPCMACSMSSSVQVLDGCNHAASLDISSSEKNSCPSGCRRVSYRRI
jgi:hypothetical protein